MSNTIEQPVGQDRNVFNTAKRFLRDLNKLDNKQLAILHFEIWHEAQKRADGVLADNKQEEIGNE